MNIMIWIYTAFVDQSVPVLRIFTFNTVLTCWKKTFGGVDLVLWASMNYIHCFMVFMRLIDCSRDVWYWRIYMYGPRQANLLLIAYASSEGSGEPAHPRSLARTFAARSYKQWVKRNLQTESQIPGPSEWLGMRSWNLSWRNARRHKFAWRGPYYVCK